MSITLNIPLPNRKTIEVTPGDTFFLKDSDIIVEVEYRESDNNWRGTGCSRAVLPRLTVCYDISTIDFTRPAPNKGGWIKHYCDPYYPPVSSDTWVNVKTDDYDWIENPTNLEDRKFLASAIPWQKVTHYRIADQGEDFMNLSKEDTFLIEDIMAESKTFPKTSIRQQVLETARDLTCGDRAKTHGDPYDNLHVFQKMWNAYEEAFDASPNAEASRAKEHKMAMFYVFSKLARIAQGDTFHKDHYVDTAAYVAIAYEVLTKDMEKADG